MKKLEKLFEMTEHPNSYTNVEWREMTGEEVLDDKIIDAAWMQFQKQYAEKSSSSVLRVVRTKRFLNLRKAAAAVSVLLIVAGVSYAALSLWFEFKRKHVAVPTSEIVIQSPKSVSAPTLQTAENDSLTGTLLFENTSLAEIMQQVSRHYGRHVVFGNQSLRELRLYYEWNTRSSLDNVVSELNLFEKVNINVSGDTLRID